MEVTRCNTERVLCMTTLMDQNRELERKINASQRKMGNKSQDYRRGVDQVEIQRLKQLVKTESQQAEALRREIGLLSRKGGHVLPPAPAAPDHPLAQPHRTHQNQHPRTGASPQPG
ncbi:cilia- and flagella-associated protein 44-like [Trematomus bernacchii]|uniref:cilia- and flagella-associated protein 44-like n=1 Tax=Trematomus bernacchii TaxID=40690 RepID=UPI00146A3678|nr:cilia- and flagella-associated protein 44-like [Trematomus bernacchii]